ncbi:hypothetical protein E4V42_22530 [Clostridium estertheticum]|uniref:Uncharacterized protein n=1 Tax=Clostridium estertheticum TaxID=238834 RepID=A0A5N7J7R9_9CLOT|nr:hypothetical protein [Clostridium estertheticum]MPQ34165.1 hypothetical protein [Clostridium estertheticum]MPQ64767.1 hypothetical protein [Clostridium estertheticum]
MHDTEIDNIDSIRNYSIIAIILIIIGIISLYNYVSYDHNKYVDINSLVNKAYTSSKGYDSDMAKYMSKDVYNNSNSYSAYKDLDYKKPIKLSLKLTEINQHKINGKIFAYMIYDFDVLDATGKSVAGSRRIPVVFTVRETNGNLYIEDTHEYLYRDPVPKIYR